MNDKSNAGRIFAMKKVTNHAIYLLSLVLIVVLVAPITGTASASKSGSTSKPFSYNVNKQIHKSLPMFRFAVRGTQDGSDYHTKTITVTRNNGQKLIQKIFFDEAESYDKLNLTFEDMNFDGYLDFRVMMFMPAGPSVPYHYYLWDAKQSKFVKNKQMSEMLFSPDFDKKSKKIYTFNREDAVTHTSREFKFVKGKLVEFSRITTKADKECYVEYRLIQGKMKMVANTCDGMGKKK
jgi:hypothetical protein